MDLRDRLIISKPLYISESANPRCGYCKGGKKAYNNFALDSWYETYKSELSDVQFNSTTIGLQAELLSVEIYDTLCNLGFRRSGSFLYKTDLLRNCCRLYTIRTNVSFLHLSKELKSCIKKYRKNIVNEEFVARSNYANFVEQLVDYEENSTNFRTVFEPATSTPEKYELFAKYQEHVHNDKDHSPRQFESFLCDSPFPEDVILGTKDEWDQLNNWRNFKPTDKLKRLGPAHECYYYNGKLIAVAVLDFLPSGMSSVYFIWDPDYAKWSLGKVSALRELAILSKINRNYYYLGYYIEDCPKMKYKEKFGGEILDVCNNQYVPLTHLDKYIANGKFFTLGNSDYGSKSEYQRDMANEEESTVLEHEIRHDYNSNLSFDKPLVNHAEQIYGKNGGALSEANNAIKRLNSLGISYKPIERNELYMVKGPDDLKRNVGESEAQDNHLDQNGKPKDIYQLPSIVPGLIPLWQIAEIIGNAEINCINDNVMVYDTTTGDMRVIHDFSAETADTKRIICNVIRLIGLENTKKSLIIM